VSIVSEERWITAARDLLAGGPQSLHEIVLGLTYENFLLDLAMADHPVLAVRYSAQWRVWAYVQRLRHVPTCTILDVRHDWVYRDWHDGHTQRKCSRCGTSEMVVHNGEYPQPPK
jgi:hypothetical protein